MEFISCSRERFTGCIVNIAMYTHLFYISCKYSLHFLIQLSVYNDKVPIEEGLHVNYTNFYIPQSSNSMILIYNIHNSSGI